MGLGFENGDMRKNLMGFKFTILGIFSIGLKFCQVFCCCSCCGGILAGTQFGF